MNWTPDVNGFKSYLKLERSFSGNTVDAYLRDITKFTEFLEMYGYDLSPQKITRDQLTEYINYLNELGLTARSQSRMLSGIKAFYKFLLLEDRIDSDPTELISPPRMDKRMPEVLTYEEVQSLIATVDLSTDHGTRNRAILETLYACGLRVTELLNLRISNLYTDIGFVKVIGKNNKERIVPISDEAIKHIQYYMKGVRNKLTIPEEFANFVFLNRRGKKLTRVMIFMIVKEAAAAAGITKNVSPHTFRHSFATHLVEGGANLRAIQDMLGHESILTTEMYTHLDNDFLRETIMSFHPSNQRKVKAIGAEEEE